MAKLILALRLIPAILKAVKAIEEELPLPKKGKEKLDLILKVAEKVSDTATDARPLIEPIVSASVNLFKLAGIFK